MLYLFMFIGNFMGLVLCIGYLFISTPFPLPVLLGGIVLFCSGTVFSLNKCFKISRKE